MKSFLLLLALLCSLSAVAQLDNEVLLAEQKPTQLTLYATPFVGTVGRPVYPVAGFGAEITRNLLKYDNRSALRVGVGASLIDLTWGNEQAANGEVFETYVLGEIAMGHRQAYRVGVIAGAYSQEEFAPGYFGAYGALYIPVRQFRLGARGMLRNGPQDRSSTDKNTQFRIDLLFTAPL